ncbi:DUF6851 domain-containing protein [Streptomyces sp. 4N509B]|uniref:DUF6851 domain-containing protein n=1 Tax=Streptomyces sp. 4N509B TaxID=3457413 RepID=UPI003FD49DDF
MRTQRRTFLLGMLGATTLGLAGGVPGARAQVEDFDFDTGNAIRDLIYGQGDVLPELIASMDVSIVIRVTHLSQNAWFDAVAPYHPTAVGIYSRLGRRPASESATNRNKNIALLYATYRVQEILLPQVAEERRAMMIALGLDPDDDQENTVTPIGIGNLAGRAVMAARLHDGMNQLGDEGGRRYHRQPYADYLGYAPVNTAYELTNPSRWQPDLTSHLRRLGEGPNDLGAFVVQQFITPQWGVTRPYALENPEEFTAPPPTHTDHTNRATYRRQVDDILSASANLNDRRKMTAEVFDNKFLAIGRAVEAACRHHELDLDGWVHLHMTCSTATFDAGIVAWKEKRRYDSVRPFSAVRHVYGDAPVTAWGGPGEGTVNDIPATEWRAYLKVGDHPEYPSGSTTLCAAQAQAARRYLDSDELGYELTIAQGSSLVEPGLVPAAEMVLRWDTWSEYTESCGLSRFWGGVHFMPTIEASWELGPQFGDIAYEFVRRHVAGEV